MIQLLITVGLCVGYFSCYGSVRIPSSLSWRLPLALHSGIACFLAIASFFYLPQSPRWLAYKGRKEEASKAWDKLGVSNAEREKDLLQNPVPIESAALTDSPMRPTAAAKLKLLDRLRGNVNDLMAIFEKDARKPLLLGIFLMSMQQLSGIDGVIYVSSYLFLGLLRGPLLQRLLIPEDSTLLYFSNKLASTRPKLLSWHRVSQRSASSFSQF